MRGPRTSAALARHASVDERYVREWLEQQTVVGTLSVDDPSVAPTERRYCRHSSTHSGLVSAFGDYGTDTREGQGRLNRAMFLQLLGREWLPAIPDVHVRLQADPPARVAEIGCGAGWASIGLSRAYSQA